MAKIADYAINHDTAQDADVFANDETEVAYNNVSLFAQGLLKVKYANFILGGRFDRHNEYGSAFSPRLGVTGLINDAHYKVLFGGAFRAPGIENIALGPVDPERTYVFEIELGYRLAKSMFITANLFDITIHDPIVYYFEPDTSDPTGESGNDAYMNYPRTGSSGLELEYRFKKQWLSVTLGYSFYSAALLGESEDGISGYLDKNRVDSYSVPDGNGALLGFPQHKINLISTIQLKNLSITPSLVWMHEKYAYAIDENDEDLYEQSDPVFMFNTWFRYKNLLIDGLTVGLGVFNILGAEYTYVQPYNDGHSPYPGQSRELVARISYEF